LSGKAKRVPASKPLPPFGRELYEARKRNEVPNVFVYAGDRSWALAQKRSPPAVLCVPPDVVDPSVYDWTICKGLALTLVVWNRPEDFVDGFARQLVIAGATLVAALTPGGSTYYRPRST
jgi:hypothetical protein